MSRLVSSQYHEVFKRRTEVDRIDFAVDDNGCTLATEDVDRLINFNVVNSYSLSLLEFLRTQEKLMIKYIDERKRN